MTRPRVARVLLLCTLTLATALAGCAESKGPAAEAPVWEPGYAWSASWSATGLSRSGGSDGQDNHTYEDSGTFHMEVVNTTLAVDGVGIYLLAMVTDGSPYLAAVRRADLADVDLDVDYDLGDCSVGDCDVSSRDLSIDDEGTEPRLKFPLRPGKSWDHVQNSSIEGLEVKMRTRATVGSWGDVDVPVGEVRALRVDLVQQILNLDEIERAIREEAEAFGVRVDELDIDFGSHEIVHYSPDYQNIVKAETSMFRSLYARGEFEGVPFEEWEDDQQTFTAVLEGARLVPRAERSVAEAASYLTGELLVNDPTGMTVETATYEIEIDSISDEINAAAGDSARFQVELDGVVDLPPEHIIRWALRDHAGQVVENATGMRFDPTVTRPGRYSVEAEAFDGFANSLSADSSELVAHWIAEVDDDCEAISAEVPIFTFANVGGCAIHDLPVHPGVQSLRVVATPDGNAVPVDGRLRVQDSVGNGVTVTPDASGSAEAFLEGFDGFRLDGSMWSAEWQQPLAIEEDVSLRVEVLYSKGVDVDSFRPAAGAEAFLDGLARLAGRVP